MFQPFPNLHLINQGQIFFNPRQLSVHDCQREESHNQSEEKSEAADNRIRKSQPLQRQVLRTVCFARVVLVEDLAAKKLNDTDPKRVNARYHRVDEEKEERLHIVQANTVGYPDAVMVHANHAALALRAVVRAWRLDSVAGIAHLDKLA